MMEPYEAHALACHKRAYQNEGIHYFPLLLIKEASKSLRLVSI